MMTGAQNADRAKLIQSGPVEGLGPDVASFGVAQWPSRKDEDRACVTGAVAGLFDAAVQLYDGHGGKLAARHCVAELVPRVTEAFFKQKACRAFRYDTAGLQKQTRDGFHPLFDAAVITAFEQLDEEIKRLDPSGTTASVLFFKKSDDSDVHVKCAWVGDSRVILTRDFDPGRTMDLSDDHKPSSPSEVFRIRKHYEALHGDQVFKSRDEVIAHFEASVRGGRESGGKGKKPLPPGFGKKGNHSPASSPGGSSRGNSRPQSRESSQRGRKASPRAGSPRAGAGPNSRGSSRNGPDLAARDGMPAVEMTLGHAVAIEEAVWGALEVPGLEGFGPGDRGPGTTGPFEVAVTTRAQREHARGDARAVTESHEASVSFEDLSELRAIAARSPGAERGARGDSANGTFSVPSEVIDSTSVAFTSVDMRRSVDEAILASFDSNAEEKTEDADREKEATRAQLAPSREPSDGGGLRVDATATATAARGTHSSEDERLRDEDGDELGSIDGDSEPAFRRVDLARMSFVGYYKNERGKALSKPRVFSSSGESHGVSRSIGDRGSARACVATPEIRTVVVPFGSGARIMACSDGVWDCFSSEKAARRVARFVSPQGAAKRVCVYARERAEYKGMYADDITAVVVDVGVNDRGGEPQCACVVS